MICPLTLFFYKESISTETHTVVSGDTLSALAKKYHTTVATLKSLNGLKSDLIKIGQVLTLPSASYGAYLILQDENGIALAHFDYEVKLSDGSIQNGTTDDAGHTSYITAYQPLEVVSVHIVAIATVAEDHCCSLRTMLAKNTPRQRGISDIPDDISEVYHSMKKAFVASFEEKKISLQKYTKEAFTLKRVLHTRTLTQSEIKLVRAIFKDAINIEKVKIHKGEFLGWLQSSSTAMTPRGEIYFPEEIYEDDYTNPKNTDEKDSRMHLFIHEMVHVWQYQQGYNTEENGKNIALQGGYLQSTAYNYQLVIPKRKKLSEFNMEQQGDIIADDYMYLNKNANFRQSVSQQDRTRILKAFKSNADNRSLLPKSSDIRQTVFGDDREKYELDDDDVNNNIG